MAGEYPYDLRTKNVEGNTCYEYSSGIPVGVRLEVKTCDCPHMVDVDVAEYELHNRVACVEMGRNAGHEGACKYLKSLLFSTGGRFVTQCKEVV